MLKIGLTGGIGSGKSTVADIFTSLGVTVIDADQISHQLTRPGTESFDAIKQLLGEEFIDHQGELDRKKIADYIFSHPSAKTALEKILHPAIKQRMLAEIARAADKAYVVLAIPLLLETDFTDLVDRIVVIDADDEIRIKRTQQRDGRSEEQIRHIMHQQIDRQLRLQRADDVVDNSGSLEALREAVSRLHQKFLALAAEN